MSAQLQQSYRPAITARPHPLPTSSFDRSHAERDAGLGLLFRFLLATSVVVAVVMLVQAVGRDWILVPAMAIHLALTYLVLHGIFLLLRDGYESDVPDAR
jgi:ABC-type Mn2+/Zn2+ transport system permease subunit